MSPTRLRTRSQPTVKPEKAVPSVAFRVLDAPRLKDDFYCSVLAYSYTCRTLAVALAHRVYLWTEAHGVRYPPLAPARAANYVTSLAFSSTTGGKAILAVARNSGHVALWSLFEQKTRFKLPHPWAACSVAWRPLMSCRQMPGRPELVACEDLLVGDDAGCLYYYSVFWPDFAAGYVVLLTKLDAHSQNICGLAWSPDGKTFTSGGNDNSALLFEADTVLQGNKVTQGVSEIDTGGICASVTGDMIDSYLTPPQSPNRLLPLSRVPSQPYITGQHFMLEQFSMTDPVMSTVNILTPPESPERTRARGRSPERLPRSFSQAVSPLPASKWQRQQNLETHLANPGISGCQSMHKKSFYHSAAVKAVAYAPWQPTLLATGGGSNDRQIHFHHTQSGSTLAVIDVFAQVTSLAWSSTSREIVATFGYAQPEHDIRIAVFAWPSCECVVSIPWERKANGEIGRALWAIPYPGGPNDAAAEKQDEEADIGFQA
ncbi:hypothetical protein LTR70_000178 [Exophiala xenobiotica]|uniref:WD40 repeat-like protein n=1 Tax=Lithohypha guttulata TaxID=1690604 RepID=A0ABR0KRA0_9EURO|nr:hypothetical protein LTR24_000303 [Lithohypha guttulata]KAK5330856.1 hypothetical protein LTR70_000178 [Exophiala xenobiotica]